MSDRLQEAICLDSPHEIREAQLDLVEALKNRERVCRNCLVALEGNFCGQCGRTFTAKTWEPSAVADGRSGDRRDV